MFCSTIIPTIGRPTLSRAVQSVLDQAFERDDFEVIVVNDSGEALISADWQRSPRVRMITTQRRNRSVARNAGAAIANGSYLHFLDDDDWMMSGAFEHFWQLSQASKAAWLHGAFRLVDDVGETIAEIFPEETGNCFINLVAWEWLPLQASMIETEAFFKVGGFPSLQSLSGGFEDIDLSRQVARYYEMDRVPALVANVRAGGQSSTTDYVGMFRQNRLSREKMLGIPGSFARMWSSANESPSRLSYWRGKMVYYFLGSAKWNLQHRRFFTAASRAVYSAASFGLAGRYLFTASFWHGLSRPHYSRVWQAVEQLSGNPYTGINYDWD